jgi:hypothetical protein
MQRNIYSIFWAIKHANILVGRVGKKYFIVSFQAQIHKYLFNNIAEHYAVCTGHRIPRILFITTTLILTTVIA